MLFVRKPDTHRLYQFLDAQSKLDFTYPEVGASATTPPPGYNVDRTRVQLGHGDAAFAFARTALESWAHFRLGWVEACPPQPRVQVGEVVGVLARVTCFGWLNACRIVYVVDEQVGPTKRFGYAYGTLPDHAEMGEERFQVVVDEAGDVWYEILAFSKPRHWLARLGNPFARVLQRRFARGSANAMVRAMDASFANVPS